MKLSDYLPYEKNANLVKSRGCKAAVIANNRVGFYYTDELGTVISRLVKMGLDVQVLAPTDLYLNPKKALCDLTPDQSRLD